MRAQTEGITKLLRKQIKMMVEQSTNQMHSMLDSMTSHKWQTR